MIRNDIIKDAAAAEFDIAIIGGGITGAGIFYEAGKRGYKCLLLDKGDFAGGTSSKSAKLIHGGLRYLQYAQIGLIRESLTERNFLLKEFPHIVKPIPFLFPVYDSVLKYRIGMILYQLMGRSKQLPGYVFLSKNETISKFPSIKQDGLKGGFIYYDAITNDARLTNEVIHLAVEQYGGCALNYCALESGVENGDGFKLSCRDKVKNETIGFKAKYVVNAAGPWVDAVLNKMTAEVQGVTAPSKGVHLVFSQKHFPVDMAIAFPTAFDDGRMLYALPWEYDSVIVGTTDTEYGGNLDEVEVLDSDVEYLIESIQDFAPELKITREHIVSSFVGIRPLYKEKSALIAKGESSSKDRPRDFKVWWSGDRILNILGGKMTTYRYMANTLMNRFEKRAVELNPDKKERVLIEGVVRQELAKDIVSDIESLYGNQSNKVFEIMQESSLNLALLSSELPIYVAEIIYFVRHQSCVYMEDLIERRLSIANVLPMHDDSEKILECIGAIMKEECGWSDEDMARQLSDVTEKTR